MKEREESFHATDIAKFYIHDKHDKVLTGSFHHPTQRRVGFHIHGRTIQQRDGAFWLAAFGTLCDKLQSQESYSRTRENSITLVIATHRQRTNSFSEIKMR